MRSPFSKFSLTIIAVVFLLIFFHWLGILSPFLGLIQRGINPIQQFFYTISAKIQGLFSAEVDFKKENQELKDKLRKLVIDQTKLELLTRENQTLREQLDFLKKKGYEYQMAHVISHGLEKERKIFIIDKGEAQRIKEGYPVIIAQKDESIAEEPSGFLLGKIIKVTPNSSHVLVLTDNRSLVAATVLRNPEVSGLVKGERGLALKLDLVQLGEEIKEGDMVITSGLEDNIPLGLIIGEIEKMESKEGDFFQKAQVKPLISFDNVMLVSVLIP